MIGQPDLRQIAMKVRFEPNASDFVKALNVCLHWTVMQNHPGNVLERDKMFRVTTGA
jgi:hypothetical protein